MIETLLNGLTVNEFLGFAFYMLLGFLLSVLAQQYDRAKVIKAYGGFKFVTWWKENWKRVSMFVIGSFLLIVFMDKYTDEQSNFSALTMGLTLDVLIDRIFNRKKV